MARRKPSQREPNGKIKAHILLYLAENGKKDLSDVKTYLTETKNIRNTKGIRTHLSELHEQGLLAKTPYRRGVKDQFFLDNDFEDFKKIYIYLKNQRQELDLLKTKYYKEKITSQDFIDKLFINQFKGTILANIETGVMSNSEKHYEDTERDKLYGEYYKKAITLLVSHNTDELYSIKESQKTQSNKDKTESSDDKFEIRFIRHISQNPLKNKHNELVNIINTSPSVIEFLINSEHVSQNLIYRINHHVAIDTYISFYTYQLLTSYPTKVSTKKVPKKDETRKIDFDDERLIWGQLENHPIEIIIKALFTYDFINSKTLTNEISDELIKYIFNTEIKGDEP